MSASAASINLHLDTKDCVSNCRGNFKLEGRDAIPLDMMAVYTPASQSVRVRADAIYPEHFQLELTIPLHAALKRGYQAEASDPAAAALVESDAKTLLGDEAAKDVVRKPATKRPASPTAEDGEEEGAPPTKLARKDIPKGMVDATGCVLVMGMHEDPEYYGWYLVPLAKFNADLEPIAKRFNWKSPSMVAYLMQAPPAVEEDFGTDEGEVETEKQALARLLEKWEVELVKDKGYFQSAAFHTYGALCMVTVWSFE